ncbi:MAG: hypothetical protein AAF975_07685 [Spirochaetota bacterium]
MGHNGLDLCPAQWRDYKSELLSGLTPPDCIVHSPVDFELVRAAPDYSNGAGAYVKGLCRWQGQPCHIYFFHLDMWFDAIKGGRAAAGEPIGVIGGSGNGQRFAFGVHLHLQIRPVNTDRDNGYGGAVNPVGLLG